MTVFADAVRLDAGTQWLKPITNNVTSAVRVAIEAAASELMRLQAVRADVTSLASTVEVVPIPTEFDLRVHAVRTLSSIISSGTAEPTPEALRSFQHAVSALVREGGPTPQVGNTATGSVEVQWLVGGELVSALFDANGDLNLYAEDASGDVLLDRDIAPAEDWSATATEVRGRLAAMGSRASARLISAS